jgi:hypothetical protein
MLFAFAADAVPKSFFPEFGALIRRTCHSRGKMRSGRISLLALTMVAALQGGCRDRSYSPDFSPQTVARSLLSDGNLSPLQRVMTKARRGAPVTIVFFGGSITFGQLASTPDHAFAGLVSAWWRTHFPQSTITPVNAGVPGTGSTYGCLRLQRDLLSHHPDLVVLEFGVNDKSDLAHAETYEGIVRQLLADPGHPAVVLLFMMHHDGTNAQPFQAEIGRRYQLPMISFRDAIWPEIAAGRMKLPDLFGDVIHPNDRGHLAVATFIDSLMQETLDSLPAESQIASPSSTLPPPRYTDLFAHTRLLTAADLKPVTADGWFYDSVLECWRSNRPGSSIEFDLPGQAVDLLYEKLQAGYGTAEVAVDNTDPIQCDSWLNGTWGPLCQTDPIYRGPLGRSHHVTIRLLSQKNVNSAGYEFRIKGFGLAGNGI